MEDKGKKVFTYCLSFLEEIGMSRQNMCVQTANTTPYTLYSSPLFSECSWPRTNNTPCDKITDKLACLTSKDNRREFEGQNCVWCKSGKCEPQAWMERTKNKKAGTDFEACLRPQSKCSQGKGTKRVEMALLYSRVFLHSEIDVFHSKSSLITLICLLEAQIELGLKSLL